MKKTFLKTALMTMAGVCMLAGSAMAIAVPSDTYITGGIGMTGAWTPVLADGLSPTTIESSAGIAFNGWGFNAPMNTFVVTSASDSFSGIPTTGTIQNIQFDSQAPKELWSVGGFTFVMDSFTYEKSKNNLGNWNLLVSGAGTLSGEGYSNTPGEWNFSGNGASNANFSWSASTNASTNAPVVPEPATMVLLGSGLMGLAFVVRKIRK